MFSKMAALFASFAKCLPLARHKTAENEPLLPVHRQEVTYYLGVRNELEPFWYIGQVTDDHFVAGIASLFDAHKIPYVMWGGALLAVYGCNNNNMSRHAFVIDDREIRRACQVLLNAGFYQCMQEWCGWKPECAEHVHLEDEDRVIQLLKHSDVLWNIPSLAVKPTSYKDGKKRPDIILSCDQKRTAQHNYCLGTGRHSSLIHPIRIPSAWRLVEALILKDQRDYGTWPYALEAMTACALYKNILDVNDLDPSHQRFFDSLLIEASTEYDESQKRIMPYSRTDWSFKALFYRFRRALGILRYPSLPDV